MVTLGQVNELIDRLESELDSVQYYGAKCFSPIAYNKIINSLDILDVWKIGLLRGENGQGVTLTLNDDLTITTQRIQCVT